ncbi:MAG: 2-phospho-L-lactate transferase [Candidatus Hydrogenedentota bacterium]|nr:MAG: 2-phospho-L-lactate transferase [Candidatus Hydrogenedentota bacterium]
MASSDLSQDALDIVVLCGGIGGVKFLEGLLQIFPAERITIIGNTGDDETFHGLPVSPDLDTILYTLTGHVDRSRGWGRASETFHCLEELARLGEDTWFQLGDRDLALHIVRKKMLSTGHSLTEVTAFLAKRLGLPCRLLPPSNDPVRTIVRTDSGALPFQEYFVRHACRPRVLGVEYAGAAKATASRETLHALETAGGLFYAPSNPVASIGPILAIPDLRSRIRKLAAPRIVVSPFVEGKSLKGPSDKMMRALNLEPDLAGLAHYYRDLADGILVHETDLPADPHPPLSEFVLASTNLILDSSQRKRSAAEAALALLERLRVPERNLSRSAARDRR